MSNVPTNLIPSTITQLPEYDGSSTLGYLPYSLNGRTYKVQFSNIAAVGAVPSTRTIATGNGLQGGGDLSQNRTISIIPHGVGYSQLDFTGVTAGTYGSANTIPAITVDDTGRVTAVVDTPVVLSNYVPSSRTVSAGAGLTGGGQLNNNITISLNPSNATPQPLGAASAGTGTQAARDDHVHPAVDLTDTSETQGVLPLGRGGTGVDLSPVLGAVIYADNDSLNQTTAGNAGQVLTSAGGLGAPYWQTITGVGTVTSVNVSGGTTGLTTSGGPVTAAGTITIGGTLIPANGGTGISSYAVGDLLFANTTSTLDKLTVGSNGYLLASNGTAPQYVNPTSVTIGTATNLAGGASGSIPYQSSAGTTTFLASGTGVLTASGGSPSYTMSPSLTQVTVAADPTTNLQVATKQYVDTIATTSVHYHTPVKYEVPNTTGNLTATYNNGASGVGATLTNAGTKTAFTPDGIVASVGDRILIYNQTNAYENGVYTVTVVGNGSTNWVLTRATDANTYDPISPNSLGGGDAFFVTSGNTGAGETYVCNNVGPITFGTTAITFVQVSATQVYSAGTGLTLTGTTFSLTAPVATSLGGTGLSSFTSGGAVYATSTSALTTGTLPITAGGTGQTTASAAFNALSPITTTGDLIIGNGANSATRLPIGANGYILTSNGTTASWGPAPSSMVYPGAGIPNSTGSAWGTSYSTTGSGTVVALATSPTLTGNIGLGAAASAGNVVRVGGSMTGAVNSFGVYNNQAIQSDVTGSASLYATFPSTAASAFTLSSLYHFNASLNSIGAGSSVTTQVGFFAQSTLTGATNNYGFYGAIASGTGRYNLYMAGTADNHIAGNLGIGTTSPNAKLEVAASTSGGKGGEIIIANSFARTAGNYSQLSFKPNSDYTGTVVGAFIRGLATNADPSNPCDLVFGAGSGGAPSERMRIDSVGNVGIGTSSPAARLHVVNSVIGSQFRIQDNTTDATAKYGTATFGHYTNAQAGILGLGVGSLSASSTVYIGGGFGTLNAATAIQFYTAANNTTTTGTEQFRISSTGAWGLSGANYGTSGQILTSNGSGSAPTWQNAPATGVTQARATALSMILGF